MTVANSKSSGSSSHRPRGQRRSWLARLQPPAPPAIPPEVTDPYAAATPQKPCCDMSDLLVMSTVDQKAPAEPPGSADLLDSLVQDHLERTDERPSPSSAPTAPAPIGPPGTEEGPRPADLSDEARVELLQKEIETLLRDTPETHVPAEIKSAMAPPTPAARAPGLDPRNPTAAAAPAVTLSASATASIDASAGAPVQTGAMPAAALSSAELDVLLARDEVAQSPLPLAGPAALSPSETEEKLTEAEGVLAEELAKLMEEDGHSAAPAAKAVKASAPAPIADAAPRAPARAESPAKIAVPEAVAAPQKKETQTTSAAAPASPPPPAAASAPAIPSTAAPAPAASPASAAAPAPASPAAETIIIEKEAEPADQTPHPRRAISDLCLALAQLVDLPFTWINEMDKNIIGIAAFMLLVGGGLLWVLSLFMGR